MIDEKKLVEKLNKITFEAEVHNSGYKGTRTEKMLRYEDVMSIINRQPKAGEWITCSERLPKPQDLHETSLEDCTEYLIQRRCCVMNIAKYIKIYGKAFFCTHGFEVNDVIAWQPLPEPYKEETENNSNYMKKIMDKYSRNT